MTFRHVFFVAPYYPPGAEAPVHLGASRKIELLLRILSRRYGTVTFINTGHSEERWAASLVRRLRINGTSVVECRPFTCPHRVTGKILNLVFAILLGIRLARKPGPSLVWLYNGYAFESLFGILMSRRSVVIVEVEDHPRSRSRNDFGIRNSIHAWLLETLSRVASGATFVNAHLAAQWSGRGRSLLLPGVVADEFFDRTQNTPFSSRPYTLGYFGGLDAEKGADLVLSIARNPPDGWNLAATGSGELTRQFREAADAHPTRVSFLESANSDQMVESMGRCDALVNPHRSIASMGNGVFPFKILEYAATGRLVMSTELPSAGFPLEDTMVRISGEEGDLRAALREAPRDFAERRKHIDDLVAYVRDNYSESAVGRALGRLIEAPGP